MTWIKKKAAVLLLCTLTAALLSGCYFRISFGLDDAITGEDYPDAGKYQAGILTYDAALIRAVEVYWRSGEVAIIESDNSELRVRESGSELPERAAMHYFLDDGTLRIRFCASGAKIQVDSADKHLSLEVPKGIDLSVHTTAAPVRADTLKQENILISAHSGNMELGTVTAERADLSSSSGFIRADSVSVQTLRCSASSGAVAVGTVSAAEKLECSTSSGTVSMGGVVSKTVEITTSSGNVDLALADVPEAVMDTVSGKITTTLSAGGAELQYISDSGTLLTDRGYERKGDLYIFDGGASKLTVETSSGNLEIQ